MHILQPDVSSFGYPDAVKRCQRSLANYLEKQSVANQGYISLARYGYRLSVEDYAYTELVCSPYIRRPARAGSMENARRIEYRGAGMGVNFVAKHRGGNNEVHFHKHDSCSRTNGRRFRNGDRHAGGWQDEMRGLPCNR